MEYIHLIPSGKLPNIEQDKPFRVVVVVEADVDAEWQAEVSKWLVDSGCVYMMAWGVNCTSWDTSVDLANLKAFNYGEIPNESFVMTTWHENEPLNEVFWFAKNVAHHANVEIVATLVLHVSTVNRGDELRLTFENA